MYRDPKTCLGIPVGRAKQRRNHNGGTWGNGGPCGMRSAPATRLPGSQKPCQREAAIQLARRGLPSTAMQQLRSGAPLAKPTTENFQGSHRITPCLPGLLPRLPMKPVWMM